MREARYHDGCFPSRPTGAYERALAPVFFFVMYHSTALVLLSMEHTVISLVLRARPCDD